MDLFHFQEEGPGVVFWHPKGWELFQSLINYIRRRQNAAGYREVNGPQILDKSLWETSGHWETFRENMFTTVTEDEREFAIKPMNCPGHVQIFKHGLRSYRELPYRVAEFGIVHRYEPSGALHGLMRVRGFTQDDAHVFCTEAQLADECLKMNDLILSIYRDFGFEEVVVKLSTRPEKRVGSDAAVGSRGGGHVRRAEADRAPSRAARSRPASIRARAPSTAPSSSTCCAMPSAATGSAAPSRSTSTCRSGFGAFYIDADGEKKTPVMIHRAMFGSMERFAGILLESTAGHLPLWLAPVQAKVCTIVSDADAYAEEVLADAEGRGPARRDRSAQREDQLQGARALARQGAGACWWSASARPRRGTVSVRRLGRPAAAGDAAASRPSPCWPTRPCRRICGRHSRRPAPHRVIPGLVPGIHRPRGA